MRISLVVAAVLIIIAAFFAWWGGLIISKIFADYKDSSDATYLTVGGGSLAISALFATAALFVASPARQQMRWVVLSVLALLAAAVPYAGMIGSPGYAVNVAVALLAAGSIVTYLRNRPPEADRK
jgi:hypothetical protein